MLRFCVKRLFQAAIAVFGVSTLIFFLQRLTGDPTLLMVPEGATEADIAILRESLGFNRPIIVQYLDYLLQLLHFDFGTAIVQKIPVIDIIASRLPYTLALAGGALFVAIGIGLPVGVFLAVFRNSSVSKFLMGIVLAGQSLPTFWSGIIFIMLFAVFLGWLPPSGASTASSLILPAVALGLLSMATFARITRSSILDEMDKLYFRSARAKGLALRRIVWRHVLRNSIIPVISVAALEVSHLLAGSVIVETVFAWPGIGLLTVQSVQARDFPIVQAIVLFGAFVTIGLNVLADILYSVVDPRIRLDGSN